MFKFMRKNAAKPNELETLKKDHTKLKEKLKFRESQISLQDEEIADLKSEIEDLNYEVKIRADELKKLDEDKSVKLSDAQAKKQLKALAKAKLKTLEEQVNAAPSEIRGGTMVYNKKSKKTSYVEFSSKSEALELIAKAKRGQINFVG